MNNLLGCSHESYRSNQVHLMEQICTGPISIQLEQQVGVRSSEEGRSWPNTHRLLSGVDPGR